MKATGQHQKNESGRDSTIAYKINVLTLAELQSYLFQCSAEFVPRLDERVDINSYAQKIRQKAITFEAWYENVPTGIIAAYFNDAQRQFGYITLVHSLSCHRGKGIAKELLRQTIQYAHNNGFKEIRLEVYKDNASAIHLYTQAGFVAYSAHGDFVDMKLSISVVKPLLASIVCLAYNHEMWVTQSLDSILQQQAKFLFEIIIAEDCSTDSTRDICLDYAKKYPDKINLITSNHNVGPKKNFARALQATRGRYIAFCDGDDYWTDPYKLQKQVDFLEAHADYAICFHPVKIWQNGKLYDDYITWAVPETTSIMDLADKNYIMTPSVVYRNRLFAEFPEQFSVSPVGDIFLHILNARHGKIKQLPDTMAVYRIHDSNIWVRKPAKEKREKWNETYELMLQTLAGEERFRALSRKMAADLLQGYRFLATCYQYEDANKYKQTTEKIENVCQRFGIKERGCITTKLYILVYLLTDFVLTFFRRSPQSAFMKLKMAIANIVNIYILK